MKYLGLFLGTFFLLHGSPAWAERPVEKPSYIQSAERAAVDIVDALVARSGVSGVNEKEIWDSIAYSRDIRSPEQMSAARQAARQRLRAWKKAATTKLSDGEDFAI